MTILPSFSFGFNMGYHTLLDIANRSIWLILNCNVKSDVIWCWKTQQSDVNATDPSGNTATFAFRSQQYHGHCCTFWVKLFCMSLKCPIFCTSWCEYTFSNGNYPHFMFKFLEISERDSGVEGVCMFNTTVQRCSLSGLPVGYPAG